MLHRVIGRDVERDQAARRVGEQPPGAGGEVLEPGADADHDVGLGADRVGRRAAGDADGPEVQRVIPGQSGFAGLGLGHGDIVRLGEGFQRLCRLRVMHPAARHDHRAFRGADKVGDRGQLALVRADPALPPDLRFEKTFGVVIGLRLHILTERQTDRTAFRRVGHGAERAR